MVIQSESAITDDIRNGSHIAEQCIRAFNPMLYFLPLTFVIFANASVMVSSASMIGHATGAL